VTRLAFLTPLPPASTGIADYSVEVLQLLAPRYEIDVFHAQGSVERDRLPASCGLHDARTLLDRHRERPYDLAIYQLGNGPAHDFLYPLLPRLPGLLVLHDLVLHHARARMFLDTEEARAYAREPWNAARRRAALTAVRAYEQELAYSYPAQAARLAAAQLGSVGDLLAYAYPLFRLPVESARVTAVHNAYMAEAVAAEVDGAEVAQIPMAAEAQPVTAEQTAALRSRYGLAQDAFVVGAFGLLTREKRIITAARAVARAAERLPHIRLLLVGAVPDRQALQAQLDGLGLGPRTVVTGRVPWGELPAHLQLADVAVHLRYPTARETSAALLRILAQGRPTIVSDLEHLADIPPQAVLRADMTDEEGEVLRGVLRLAVQPAAREELGRNAAAFIARAHSPARCLEGYVATIERARQAPAPPARKWPDHWQAPAAR
jgi:glycosyltransferase involved in cell wall biosynthesis